MKQMGAFTGTFPLQLALRQIQGAQSHSAAGRTGLSPWPITDTSLEHMYRSQATHGTALRLQRGALFLFFLGFAFFGSPLRSDESHCAEGFLLTLTIEPDGPAVGSRIMP